MKRKKRFLYIVSSKKQKNERNRDARSGKQCNVTNEMTS